MNVASSHRVAVMEASVAGLFTAVAVGGFIALTLGIEEPVRIAVIGGASGVITIGYYLVRFRRKAPASVDVTDQSLTIHWRDRTPETVYWDTVREANHDSEKGLRWLFAHTLGETTLRDDGFGVDEWTQITMAINAALEARSVPVEKSKIAALFDE